MLSQIKIPFTGISVVAWQLVLGGEQTQKTGIQASTAKTDACQTVR